MENLLISLRKRRSEEEALAHLFSVDDIRIASFLERFTTYLRSLSGNRKRGGCAPVRDDVAR
jgi:hypothetical protein